MSTTPRLPIDPQELIEQRGIDQLCASAESYFARLADPTAWLTKPFSSLLEAPELLQYVGLLLSGLRLGKTMTVLDFGAGSCWLSRILIQLQCRAIACDVSRTALEIGRQLFAQSPPLGPQLQPPTFLFFDGWHLDLPDNAVDRIICNDAFHHVPNETAVLQEFARVLKPGGIAGFSEPGPRHSLTPQSQLEMNNFGVLERDIDLAGLAVAAREAGFTAITCKVLSDMERPLEQYMLLFGDQNHGDAKSCDRAAFDAEIIANVAAVAQYRSVFFLYKGQFIPDSRQHLGLRHTLTISPSHFHVRRGQTQPFTASIQNAGSARWLTSNFANIGIVKLASHLYDRDGQLIAFDFSRHPLPGAMEPGENTTTTGGMVFQHPGSFLVTFDLVAEGVSWFEMLGSTPQTVTVTVE
jgi:SAM-dependent methyltransferase